MFYTSEKRLNKSKYVGLLTAVLVLSMIIQCMVVTNVANSAVTSELTATIEANINGSSNGMVTLKWNDYLVNEKYYKIEKKTDSGQFVDLQNWISANATSYYDYSITKGHTYTYRVTVVDSTNTTYIYTNELTFSLDDLDKPNSFTVTPFSYNQMDLKWSYPNQRSFNTIIERRAENETTWYQIAKVGIGQYTFSDKGIASGVRYFYRIRSCTNEQIITTAYPNDSGTSAYSLLYKPTEVYGFALSSNQIQIKWQDNSYESGFIIERRSPEDGTFKELTVVGQNITSYTDILSKNGTPPNLGSVYVYRIKAVIGNSYSEYSDAVSVTNTYLKAPYGVVAECVDGKNITVKWQDTIEGETGFEIWRRDGKNAIWERYADAGRNATVFVDESITPETTYSYKIRAKINDNNVRSDYSNEASIWTSAVTAPNDLTYKVLSQYEIELNWNDTSNIEAGFKVEKKMGFDGKWYEVANLDPNSYKYSEKIFNANDVYYYRIKTYDRFNAVSYSNEIVVTMQAPDAPSALQAQATSSNEVELSWKDNSFNENEFVIEALQFYRFTEIGRVGANVTTFVHKGLLADKSVKYRVKAVNGANISKYSNERIVTTKKEVLFPDLKSVGWAIPAISNLASRNVFDINISSAFKPHEYITRAEYCAMVIKSLELGKVSAGRYTDVTSKHKYYKELMVAAKLGILTPDKTNRLYPEAMVTRGQAGIMLALAAQVKEEPLPEQNNSVLKQFMDYRSIPEEMSQNIAAVCGADIITGRAINGRRYLELDSYVTRAEASVMIFKLLNTQSK